MSTFRPEALLGFATRAFETAGMGATDARLCADTLVQAELWGHASHGMLRLPWYLAKLRGGTCNPRAVPELVLDAGGLALLDGQDGMGQVVAAHAMREAVARARAHGIGAVAVRNSGHFGTAMYFTRQAAAQGCVAFLSTNASPAMAPWGGREKRVGNNPWSWAAPVGDAAPMVLDIANTGVARGKIHLAHKKNQPIPPGWALDAAGAPTTDAAAAIEGIILPMAGHKGSGISIMMDVLSGVLSGSAFGTGVAGPYDPTRRSGAGHLMIALDIAALMPPSDFAARMRALVAEIKGTPRAQGVEEVLYPGEPEARSEARLRREGITLPADTQRDLAALGLGAPHPMITTGKDQT